MKTWLVSISSAEPRESSILQQVIWWMNLSLALSLALEMPSFAAIPSKFHSMKQFWLHYYYKLQNYKCVLKELVFKAENANALRLPGCFRGTNCAKLGHPSSRSWCRQGVAFAFTLTNSAAVTVFHRRKLQSLPYHPTKISALSNWFQFPIHNFSLQACSSEMSGCALCLCYPQSTPSPSSSHPGNASPGCHPDNCIIWEHKYHNDF